MTDKMVKIFNFDLGEYNGRIKDNSMVSGSYDQNQKKNRVTAEIN